MPQFGSAFLTTYGTQALSATVIGLLLVHFYRRYRKEYLLDWYASWFALLLYHGATALDIFLITQGASIPPVRLITGLLASVGMVLQGFWLVAGSHRLGFHRPLREASSRRILFLLMPFAAGLALLLTLVTDARERLLVLTGVHALVWGAALLVSARMVEKQRPHSGFTLFAWVCRGYVLFEMIVLAGAVAWVWGLLSDPYPLGMGIVELLVQFGLGLGMIISLLEDEREAAALAASEIEHLAYHDGLTGLPNRALFFDRLMVALAHASRVGRPLAVVFVDLDRFKEINDSLGHSSGDILLRAAADRIRATLRAEDTVARFGGDEFTLVLGDLTHADDALQMASLLSDALRVPFNIVGHEVVVTASIGVAFFDEDGSDPESLVKNADTAMYRAKDAGRDRIVRYTPEMNASSLERLELETSLRHALAENQLVLYYQPLYDLDRQRMFGLEALIRWRHPQLGLLSPAVFIPAAEASGLIIPIGAWVINEAARQARLWQDEGLDLVVAVNLSGRQIQQPDLATEILTTLERHALAPARFEVEITETVAMQDVEQTLRVLHELRNKGVRVSIDDFGTGYSSLSYLKQFPIDTIKLDRSFVHDITAPQDAAIARTVIAMAHSLQMKVLAEGVETEHQLRFLEENSCDRLQGYFYSVPLSADLLREFISRNVQLFDGNS